VWPYDPKNIYEMVGGAKFFASAGLGTAFGWWYFAQKMKHSPVDFYSKIALRSSRVLLGFVVGATIGWLKFGDR